VQRILNANHAQSHGVGTIFKDTDNVWGDGTETNVETPAADAAYGLAQTWDFYLNTFNRNGIADDGVAGRGFVHYGTNYVNAFWADDCFCMEFGDGSAASGISNLTSLDVGGHEMTHGVTSRTAKLVYAGESGGLNESTSDVMGTMVEWYANNSHDVPDYVIGEEIFRSYDPATNYIRRMDRPSMDGASKDCWYSGVGGVDVHYSSGVGNHLFYLLSEGSGKKTINGIDYDSPTCDGSTITGIGRDKAAAIWYKALTENWVSTTDYHDARVGMLQAAKDLYGQNSTEYKTVDKAWAAVDVTP
jgi:Zn-dependent metalloprotease